MYAQKYHKSCWTAAKPRIVVTQPRRVAATSLARRVAEEVGCQLGGTVGYTVRFDDRSSQATRLKYVTDGTLLQEILGDPLLDSYDIVVIDEAHERSLRTDMILGFLKQIQAKRRQRPPVTANDPQKVLGPLKIIVMSATLDAQRFSEFYDKFVRCSTRNGWWLTELQRESTICQRSRTQSQDHVPRTGAQRLFGGGYESHIPAAYEVSTRRHPGVPVRPGRHRELAGAVGELHSKHGQDATGNADMLAVRATHTGRAG